MRARKRARSLAQCGWILNGSSIGERLAYSARANIFSYVPRIAYNNNDAAGGPPFGIAGNQTGTRIAGSDAFNFTAGLNLSVPVN